MPFVAEHKQTKEKTLAWTLREEDRHSTDYRCPICGDDFSIVLPKHSNITPHFRHRTKQAHGEPESPDHLEMKKFFYDKAKERGLDVELEYRFPTPEGWDNNSIHVVDVLVKTHKKSTCKGVAIECQCSPISHNEMVERTRFYLEHKYTPVWVWGPNYFNNAAQEKYSFIKKVEQEAYTHHNAIFYYGNGKLWWGTFNYILKKKGVYALNELSFKKFFETASGQNVFNRAYQNDLPVKDVCGAFYKNGQDWVPLIEYPHFESCDLIHKNKKVGFVVSHYIPSEKEVHLTFFNLYINDTLPFKKPYGWLLREYPSLRQTSSNGSCAMRISRDELNEHYVKKLFNAVAWVFSFSDKDEEVNTWI